MHCLFGIVFLTPKCTASAFFRKGLGYKLHWVGLFVDKRHRLQCVFISRQPGTIRKSVRTQRGKLFMIALIVRMKEN